MDWLYVFVTGVLFIAFVILIIALGFTMFNMFRKTQIKDGNPANTPANTCTSKEGFSGGGGIKRSASEKRRRSRSRSKRNKRIKNIQEKWKVDESRHSMVLPTMYATQIPPGINSTNMASIQESMRKDGNTF